MYVVTNREVNKRRQGLDLFGDEPNAKGPNELRIVKVTKKGSDYETELLDDMLSVSKARELKRKFRLKIDERVDRHASLLVACEVMAQAMREQRNVLIYMHGYNNDMKDVVKTVEEIESLYGIVVVPFSWPANGGGFVSGTAAYVDDKRDARASMDALNRFLEKLHFYHSKLTEARRNELMLEAVTEHPRNPSAAQARFTELLDDACKIKLSMMCHSMGSYVLKYALRPSGVASRELIFDNVSLVAADANNDDHESWVEYIEVRNRLYIVINENDFALEWSRRKPGSEQRARLGHYLRNLVARNAYYIDVTHAKAVNNAHAYYTGAAVEKNAALKELFAQAFGGGRAEEPLEYAADLKAYRLF